jgi:IclR family pca regulon transcriptional regulator
VTVPKATKSGSAVTLERGLAILATFGRERGPLGLTEVARRLDMRPATVHRYLKTLTNLGYLQQDVTTLKYRLDVKAADLGLAAFNSLDVREVARPHLRQLCDAWTVTVNMAVLDGTEIVYVERMIGRRSMDLPISVGSRQPAYCTSMGKALLAFLNDDQREAVIAATEFVARGPRTIVSPEKLRAELRRIRTLGYAMNNEELARGLRSVAAPIRRRDDEVVAAINLHTTPFSVEEMREQLAPAVMETAAAISRQLGAAGTSA